VQDSRLLSRKFWLIVGALAGSQALVVGMFQTFSALLEKKLITDVIYERLVSTLMFNDAMLMAGLVGFYFGVNYFQNRLFKGGRDVDDSS